MKKFEYKTVTTNAKAWFVFGGKMDPSEADKELNLLGQDGWELVSAAALTGTGSTRTIAYFLKREITD